PPCGDGARDRAADVRLAATGVQGATDHRRGRSRPGSPGPPPAPLNPPRLVLDENIPAVLAVALRNRGFDVVSAAECGMLGQPDEELLRIAAIQERACFLSTSRPSPSARRI